MFKENATSTLKAREVASNKSPETPGPPRSSKHPTYFLQILEFSYRCIHTRDEERAHERLRAITHFISIIPILITEISMWHPSFSSESTIFRIPSPSNQISGYGPAKDYSENSFL